MIWNPSLISLFYKHNIFFVNGERSRNIFVEILNIRDIYTRITNRFIRIKYRTIKHVIDLYKKRRAAMHCGSTFFIGHNI